MEKLYVLAGKARSGKNLAASILEEKYKDKVVLNYSCTAYLKKYIMMLYDWNGSEEDKPRDLLQTFGRKIREKYPNYFIQRMREDINFLSNYCDIMIITGIRLVSELDFLKKEYDGILIKFERDEDNKLSEKQKKDITETDVDNYNDYDFVFQNNSDFESLKKKILEEIV